LISAAAARNWSSTFRAAAKNGASCAAAVGVVLVVGRGVVVVEVVVLLDVELAGARVLVVDVPHATALAASAATASTTNPRLTIATIVRRGPNRC
jgi:hypothetical protein